MRVLFVTSPGIGHVFPVVSTAWAVRAAGHEVIVGTGGHHATVANAGLPVVDTSPGVDFAAVFRGFFGETPMSGGQTIEQPEAGAEFAGRLFAEVSGHSVDGTLALVERWRPDLVVHSPLQGAGPLAAAVAGVPSVLHQIGLGQVTMLTELITQNMAEHFERLGVEIPRPAAVLDVTPPSMRDDEASGWPMRYVPYNGGAVLEPWLLEPRDRPRITVTLGSVVPQMGGVGGLRPLVAAAGKVDAEFVFALGGVDLSELGELPANIRPVDWVPLGALLRASDAVVHHGGAGTTLTALDAGLPQLVVPYGADQFINAAAVAKAGVGTTGRPEQVDADLLGELLSDPARRQAAQAVAAEMATQPTPADLVPALTTLVSGNRR